MLTIEQFQQLMDDYDVKCSFSHFSEEVAPPFIAWLSNVYNFIADNHVYYSENEFTVELYTTKSQTLAEERKLEDYFNSHSLIWEKDYQSWIDEEKIMLSSYIVYG